MRHAPESQPRPDRFDRYAERRHSCGTLLAPNLTQLLQRWPHKLHSCAFEPASFAQTPNLSSAHALTLSRSFDMLSFSSSLGHASDFKKANACLSRGSSGRYSALDTGRECKSREVVFRLSS